MHEALRAPASWDDPKIDFWLSELGVWGGKDDVAHQGELAASTKLI
jgi:hypothetical protein